MDSLKEIFHRAPVNSSLIVINILVFLIAEITGGTENAMHMLDLGAANPLLIVEQREYYRLFTSMFLHFGMAHLANNMLVLFVIGENLERAAGGIRYLIIYLLGGLGGNLVSCYFSYTQDAMTISAGASGAIFGTIGAMIYVLLVNKGRVENLTIRQIAIMAAFSLYFGYTSHGVDNAAHVGGLLVGFFAAFLFYRRKKRVIGEEL